MQGVVQVPSGSTKRTVLLEGSSGTGKTKQFEFLVNGAPEHGDAGKGYSVLLCSTERKLTTLDHLDKSVYTVDVFDYPDPRNPNEVAAYVGSTVPRNLCQLIHLLRKEDHGYDVLFIDSLMRWTMRLLWRIGGTNENPDARSDYVIFGRKVQGMLDDLATLTDPTMMKRPLHVVATWGVEKGEDWEGYQKQTVAIDGKKVGPNVPYFFDDVLMLKAEAQDGKDEPLYCAYTRASQKWDAKVSGNVPPGWPAKFAPFNLYKAMKWLSGEWELRDGKVGPKVASVVNA